MITLKELPVEAILTFWFWRAFWHFIILHYHIFDDISNGVRGYTDSPTFVTYHVVNATRASVTLRLERISEHGTGRGSAVTNTHIYWVSSMADMVGTSEAACLRGSHDGVWRDRETEASSC